MLSDLSPYKYTHVYTHTHTQPLEHIPIPLNTVFSDRSQIDDDHLFMDDAKVLNSDNLDSPVTVAKCIIGRLELASQAAEPTRPSKNNKIGNVKGTCKTG